jgi:D-2-hydroxyacid dehydrogenase (NADP+)
MPDRVNVTIALPVAPPLAERIHAVDSRLAVTELSRAQRRAYRGGRPLWAGYQEPAGADDETEEEAAASLAPIFAQAEVVLSNPIVPEDLLKRAPALKWLQLTSAGVDRLIDSPIVRSHITVTTASGIHATPISEYVIGAMLAFAKGFPRALQAQQSATWRPYIAQELESATIGIIGMGAIGARTAELAKALRMRVLAMRRSVTARTSETGVPSVDEYLPVSDLPYLLAECDYLVLALPLTAESRHIIGEAELRQMKPTAVIVNIARGAVIDEEALIVALKEGRIAGAALDVFEREPLPPESPLWSLPNVLLTPHISGGTPVYMERAVDLFCDNLRRHLAGKPLRNVVDLERGY